jgi:uncharacterized protein YjbJ (UPF0337 family)
MSEHEKAEQARKGLIDSIKGKAKEIVGAVTGNDSLTAEGQLEQTQAQQRKEANSVEAVADAEAAQARAEAAHARVDGAHERIAVNAETAAVENRCEQQSTARGWAVCPTRRCPSAGRARRAARYNGRNRGREVGAATEAAVPRQNIGSSVQAASTAKRGRRIGGRPTNCPTKPTCPERRPER